MVSLNQARLIAEKYKGEKVDSYTEFEDAYVFKSKNDEQFSFGGDQPVAIMKETGKPCPLVEFYEKEHKAIGMGNL